MTRVILEDLQNIKSKIFTSWHQKKYFSMSTVLLKYCALLNTVSAFNTAWCSIHNSRLPVRIIAPNPA